VRVDPLANPQPLIERVYSYVAYRVGDGVHAEDITSEVFERALRYRKRYDERRGSPVSWLIGIARRVIVDHVTSEQPLVAEIPEQSVANEFEDQIASRLELRAAVQSLPDRDREFIALRFGADLTATQIARILGLRTNTVEVAMHRALATLRRSLEAAEEARAEETRALSPLHRVI
jgi:RNA polymerase sigma factor (sigma-70 family)